MAALQCLSVGFLAVFCVSLTQCSMLGQVGDREPVDMNDPLLQKVFQFATTAPGATEINEYFNKKSNNMYYMMVTGIVDDEDHPVKKQVVKGLNFFFTVELESTNCRKTQMKTDDLSSCKISDEETSHHTHWCDVAVNVVPWEDTVSFVERVPFKCYPAKEKKSNSKKLKFP